MANTGNTNTSYTDATATEAGVRYTYRVKAIRDGERSEWSNYATVLLPSPEPGSETTVPTTPALTPTTAPEPEPETDPGDLAPTGLTAEVVDGGVALTWNAPAEETDSVTGYEVLRARGEAELTTLESDTGTTDASYTDTTATTAGETYSYRVKAIRGEERSQESNLATAEIPEDVLSGVSNEVGPPTTFTVNTTGIIATDGLANRTFSYRWVRVDGTTETQIGTDSPTYTLVPEDKGKTIKVKLGFSDNGESAAEDILVRNTGQTVSSVNYSLNEDNPKIAQAFTTGTNAAGYELDSVGVRFGTIADTLTAGGELTASVNADSVGEPGDLHCALTNPGTFIPDDVNAFAASDCTLESGATYFVVIERANSNTDVISLRTTSSTSDDADAAPGWSVGDNRLHYASSSNAWGTETTPHIIQVRGSALNNPATGAPSIQGTLRQGEALTAGTGGIADADGIAAGATFACQWMRVDGGTSSDISGATRCSYTLRPADVGKVIKVRVTFTDLEGNSETLTSAATDAVQGQVTTLTKSRSVTPVQKSTPVIQPQVSAVTLVSNLGQRIYSRRELNETRGSLAQDFTTGWNVGGYTLSSVEIFLWRTAGDPSPPANYSLTINKRDEDGNPGDVLCTFVNPDAIADEVILSHTPTYTAPTGSKACPTLAARTTYFVALHLLVFDSDNTVYWGNTDSTSEDSGRAAGWRVGNVEYLKNGSWSTGPSHDPQAFRMSVKGSAVSTPAGITVSETELTVQEGDSTGATYTVRLDTEPSANATVDIAGHSNTDVSVSNSTPTFTTGNWGKADREDNGRGRCRRHDGRDRHADPHGPRGRRVHGRDRRRGGGNHHRGRLHSGGGAGAQCAGVSGRGRLPPVPGHPEPHLAGSPDGERRGRRRRSEHHEQPAGAGHHRSQPDLRGLHGGHRYRQSHRCRRKGHRNN